MKKSIFASTLIAASFALSVPAFATDLPTSAPSGDSPQASSGVIASGEYSIASGESQGWFTPWYGTDGSGGAGSSSLSFGSGTTFSGEGLIGIWFNQGSGDTVESVDLTNVTATNFSGQLIVLNNWNNETDVKLSGSSWANVEYVFANAVDDATIADKYGLSSYTRGDLTGSDFATKGLNDVLALQGATTLAGVTGASKGVKSVADTNGNTEVLCEHEFITVVSEGTTLTIAGSGEYAFYGTLGANYSGTVTRASLAMTGSGSQTFGGTNYLYAVTASAGTLILSGTNDISSTVSVADGGRLNISGTTTFGSTVTVADGGTLELGGEITLSSAITNAGTVIVDSDVVFVLDNLTASGNTYTIISGEGTITGWESLDYTNFGLDSARQLTSSENGSVTIDKSQSAQNLTWAGSSGGTWDSGNGSNTVWTNSSNADSFYNGDNVTFSSSDTYAITVSGNVHAGTMTVSSGTYTFSSDTTNGGTLKADTLNMSGGNITFSVDATIGTFNTATGSSASGKTITLTEGTTVTVGELTNAYGANFVLEAGSVLTATTATFSPGSTACTVSGTGTFSTGSLTLSNYANYTFTGVTFIADTVTMGSNAGSLTFSGASATIGTLTISTGGATVIFSGSSTTYTINTITKSGNNTADTLQVGSGATVNVGTLTADWYLGTIQVDGVLNISGTAEFGSGAGSTETFTGEGTVTVGTLQVGHGSNGSNGATVEIGGGLTFIANSITTGKITNDSHIQLGNATFGTSNADGLTFARTVTEVTLTASGEAGKTTFNTNLYDVASNSFTTTGTTITIGVSVVGGGDMEVTGSGTLVLSGTSTLGSVTVDSGATLDLSGGTVSVSSSIQNSGTVVVNSSTVFVLDNLTGDGNTYKIITNVDSGSITGDWGSLDESNFYISGSTITSVDVTESGQVTIVAEAITGLIWNGGTGDWNTSDTNWKQDGSSGKTFSDNADVWFDRSGSGTVTVDNDGVTAGSVTVTGGTYSFTGGSITVTDTFTINKGAEVDLSGSDSIEGNVVVSGTLKLAGSGGGTGEIIGTITINDGGWVELDTGDATGYSSGVTAITINTGGTLYVGTTSNQTLGSCTLTLVGGTIDGVEGSNLDLYGSGSKITVQAESGASAENPTVSTVTNVMLTPRASDEYAQGTTTVEVEANAVLDVQSGFWAGPNNYSNSLQKTGLGTLEVSGYFALNEGSLIIDVGTVILSGYAGGTITAAGATNTYAFASSVTIAAGANLEICFKEDASISNVSGAGDFTKSGETKLTIAGYTVSGTTTVSGGTLVLTGETIMGGSAEIHVETGATLDLTGVTKTQTEQANKLDVLYIEGGTVTVQNLANGWGGRETNFGSGMYNYTLQISNGGVLEVTAAQTVVDTSGGERAFAVTSGEGTYRFSGTGTSYIASTARNIHVADDATLIFDVVDSDATLDVSMVIAKGLASGDSDTVTKETSSGSLVKTGEGTLKLSGENLYSGGTTIKEGVLVAASSSALGTGEVKIEGGAQLSVSEDVTITNAISVTLNEAYQCVSYTPASASAGSGQIAAYASGDEGIYAITGTGGTLNSAITIFLDETIKELLATAGEEGMSFYLVDISGVSQGTDFAVSLDEALQDAYNYTYTDGILWIAAAPEPSMFGVFFGLGAIGLVATRRRRRRKVA